MEEAYADSLDQRLVDEFVKDFNETHIQIEPENSISEEIGITLTKVVVQKTSDLPSSFQEKESVDLGDLPEITRAIERRRAIETDKSARLKKIYTSAWQLLNASGIKTSVNGSPALVTSQAVEHTVSGNTLFVRLGVELDKADNPSGQLGLLLSTDQADGNITTATNSFSAFTIANTSAGLQVIGGEPVADEHLAMSDTKYLDVAETILGELTAQFDDAYQKDMAEINAAEEALQAEKANRHSRRRRTRNTFLKRAGGTILIVAGLYNHLVYEPDNLDAKIGPVPMPAPVEWIVDWANYRDHHAQGFPEAAGALALSPDSDVSIIPVIDYTREFPSQPASAIYRLDEKYNGSGEKLGYESKPGMYKLSFSRLGNDVFDNTGCVNVYGNFETGKTSVFTTDPETNNAVNVNVTSPSLAQVCLKPLVPRNFQGNIEFYKELPR